MSSSRSSSRFSTSRHTDSFSRIFSCNKSLSSCSLAFCYTSSWMIYAYCTYSFSRIATDGKTPKLLRDPLVPNLPSLLELFLNSRRDYDFGSIFSYSSLTVFSRLASLSSSLSLAD
jgi:hypothetical protein